MLLRTLVLGLLLALSGCLPSYLGGWDDVSTGSQEGAGTREIKVDYSTELEFTSDLTIVVDSLFAQIEAGDESALEIARDYIRPGKEHLARQYAIALPNAVLTPRSERSRLEFNTTWSNWRTPRDGGRTAFLDVLASSADDSNCRWRTRLDQSSFEFNIQRPRHFQIRAKLLLEVQCHGNYGLAHKVWGAPSVDQQKLTRLGDHLRSEIKTIYRAYLHDRFGIAPVDR